MALVRTYPHAETPEDAYCAFDAGYFHPGCAVQFHPHGGGSRGGTLWCPTHRVTCDLEAAARRATLAEAKASASRAVK